MPPTLSIIIVSWNVRDLLRQCLRTLPLHNAACEVLVVDSASADGTPAMVQAEFPSVRLMASPENLGYSRGNNVGLQAAQGRYLLVLNPDTEVLGESLAQMVAYMEDHPEVGVLGPQLRFPNQQVQSTRRRFPTLATLFFESTWLQGLAPCGLLERYYVREVSDTETVPVDWVVGAALLVRREAYAQVGGLDEGFFMYSEELDWQRRLRAAGWQVVYFPQAQVVHHEAQSSAQVPAATHIRFNASKVRYTRKYHGAFWAAALRWFLLANFAAQWLLEAAKWVLGHKRPLRAKRIEVYEQVLRSRLETRD